MSVPTRPRDRRGTTWLRTAAVLAVCVTLTACAFGVLLIVSQIEPLRREEDDLAKSVAPILIAIGVGEIALGLISLRAAVRCWQGRFSGPVTAAVITVLVCWQTAAFAGSQWIGPTALLFGAAAIVVDVMAARTARRQQARAALPPGTPASR